MAGKRQVQASILARIAHSNERSTGQAGRPVYKGSTEDVLRLAEAYAWVSRPDQGHGAHEPGARENGAERQGALVHARTARVGS